MIILGNKFELIILVKLRNKILKFKDHETTHQG